MEPQASPPPLTLASKADSMTKADRLAAGSNPAASTAHLAQRRRFLARGEQRDAPLQQRGLLIALAAWRQVFRHVARRLTMPRFNHRFTGPTRADL